MALTKVTYSMIDGAPVNVLDFGADNTGSTDSTTAINAAIQYAKTNGIQSINFPYGEYTVSGKINIAGNFGDGVLIEGNDSTITSTADTSVFYINASLPEAAPQYRINVMMQNFVIVGKGKSYTSSIGVEIVDAAAVKLDNINIKNCYRGLYGYGCLISDFSRIIAQNCFYGFNFVKSSTFAPNDLHFAYCKLYDNTIAIQHLEFPNGSATYIGCEIEGNNQSGTTTDNRRVTEFFDAGKVTLLGCHFENNPGQYNILYSSNNRSLNVIGCEIIPGDSCGTVLEISNGSGNSELFVEGSRVTNNVGVAQINVNSGCSALIIGTTSGYVVGTNVTRIYDGRYAANSVWKMDIGGPGGTTILTGNRIGASEIEPGITATQSLGTNVLRWGNVFSSKMTLTDGITAPTVLSGNAQIYVDAADGDLKIIFGDGTVKTIVTDT